MADWSKAETTLDRWNRRARESQEAQYSAEKAKRTAHSMLGITAAVLSSFTSVSAVTAMLEKSGNSGKIVTAVFSVLSSIVLATQAFLKLEEKATKHNASGAGFGSLRRAIEIIEATPQEQRADISTVLGQISTEYNRLSKEAPVAKLSDKQTEKLNASYKPVFQIVPGTPPQNETPSE